jgi:hypothetical protein
MDQFEPPIPDTTAGCPSEQSATSFFFCSPCNAAAFTADPSAAFPADLDKLYDYVEKQLDNQVDNATQLSPNTPKWVQWAVWLYNYKDIGFIKLKAGLSALFSRILPLPKGCDTDRVRNLNAVASMIGAMESQSIFVPQQLKYAVNYAQNFSCQSGLPGPGELNIARQRGFISQEQWTFGRKLLGDCIPWAERIYQAGQVTYSIGEVFRLWNLGAVSDDDLPRWLKRQGVTNEKLIDGYKLLYETVPGVGDCFDAMSRNTEDQDVQESLGLNDDFDERFTGWTKAWMMRSGYSEQMVRFLWRLRRPTINQRVILRLYKGGQFQRDDLVQMFRFNGYPRKIAEKLADSIIRANWQSAAKTAGQPTVAELQTAFFDGVLTYDQFKQDLRTLGCPDDFVDNFANAASLRKRLRDVKRVSAWAKRAYLTGRLSDDELGSVLQSNGVSPDQVSEYRTDWAAQKQYSNKQLQLKLLCDLVGSGHLDISTYTDRAKNLGYNAEDAIVLATNCSESIMQKRALQVEKEQKKALAEAQKANAARRKVQRELDRLAKQRWPCKAKAKPTCPAGEEPPILPTEAEILSGAV